MRTLVSKIFAWFKLHGGLPENEPGLTDAERQELYDRRQW